MLVEKKENLELLEEIKAYKIIVKYSYKEKNVFMFSLSLDGERCPATSMDDGIINHKPNQEEVEKALELAKQKENLEYEMGVYNWSVKVKKIKIQKTKRVITRIEKNIIFCD